MSDMGEAGFLELVEAFKARGYPEEVASHYAACLGDDVVVDENGLWVIRDLVSGVELARIPPMNECASRRAPGASRPHGRRASE